MNNYQLNRNIFSPLIALLLLGVLLPNFTLSQTEEELKEKADDLFKKEAYFDATSLYLRLLSLNPRDYNLNYRYGACLLYNAERKNDAFKYLNYASKGENVENKVFYFLGKAYHLTYHFKKAIKYYEKYKSEAGKDIDEKLQVDRQIQMCKNGKTLLNNLSKLIVLSKQKIDVQEFFRLYKLDDIGGTILVTKAFQMKEDKKRNHIPLIHFPSDTRRVFYASYGDKAATGLDIYVRNKLPDGKWSLPQPVNGDVNTPYDENFPFMQAGGQYLYFSSKGHNSMGGYDVFRAKYIPETNSFSQVENLDFSISSSDNDLFYVVDSLNENAYFASNRTTEKGQVEVYKVRVERIPNQLVIFKGNFFSKVDPGLKTAKIEVFDYASGEKIGSYTSSVRDGSYLIVLPRAGKYKYSVSFDGVTNQCISIVTAPNIGEIKPIKQTIVAYKEENMDKVTVTNMRGFVFEDEDDILAQVIDSQSKLQPNSEKFNLDSLHKVSQQKSLLSDVGLDKFAVAELDNIASNDVKSLSTSIKEKEATVKKLTQIIQNAIVEAKKSNEASGHLIEKASKETNVPKALQLVNQSVAQKQNANKQYQKAILSKSIAQDLITDVKEEYSKLEKAKEIKQIFSNVSDTNLVQTVKGFDKNLTKYIAENFNHPVNNDNLSYLPSEELNNKKENLDNEIYALNTKIEERNTQISQLEVSKASSSKKEVKAIDLKIEKLHSENATDKEFLGLKEVEQKQLTNKIDGLNTKQNIIEEANMMDTPSDSVQLNLASFDQDLQQLKNENSKNTIDQLSKRGEAIMAQVTSNNDVAQNDEKIDNSSAATSENKQNNDALRKNDKSNNANTPNNTINQSNSNDVKSSQENNGTNKNVYAEYEKELAQLDKSEQSEEAKAKSRLKIQQKWMGEIEQSIEDKKSQIKEEPDNTELQNELSQLQNEKNKKQEEISALEKQLNDSETEMVTENKTDQNANQTVVHPPSIASLLPEYKASMQEINALQNEEKATKKQIQLERKLIEAIDKKIAVLQEQGNEDTAVQSTLDELKQLKISTQSRIASLQEKENAVKSEQNLQQDTLIAESKSIDNNVSKFETQLSNFELKEIDLRQQLELAGNGIKKEIKKQIEVLQEKKSQFIADNITEQTTKINQNIEKSNNFINTNPTAELKVNQLAIAEQQSIVQKEIAQIKQVKKKHKAKQIAQAYQAYQKLEALVKEQTAAIGQQKLVDKLLAKNNLQANALASVDKLEYENQLLSTKITSLEAAIAELKQKQSKKHKKIDNSAEITQKRAQIVQLNELILKNQEQIKRIENANAKQITIIDNATALPLPSESKINDIALLDEYETLKNKINELQLLTQKAQSLKIDRTNTKNEINALLQQTVQEKNSNKTNNLQTKIDEKINVLKQQNADIASIRSEIEKINEAITAHAMMQGEDKDYILSMATHGIKAIANEPKLQNVGLSFVPSANSSVEKSISIGPIVSMGLEYRVQIGAFSKPVDQETFKEFTPIKGETIPGSKLIRYVVGRFGLVQSAIEARRKIRLLGYKDAFIVAYCDGKRISVSKAENLLKSGQCSLNKNLIAAVPKAKENTAVNSSNILSEATKTKLSSYNKSSNAAPATAIEITPGLFYTVQVGVYNYPVPAKQLFNIHPLFTKLTEQKQIRYSTGKFDNVNTAVTRKNEIRKIGIGDAFVTAYYNGKRISVAKAKQLLETLGKNILTSNIEQVIAQKSNSQSESNILFDSIQHTKRAINQSLVETKVVSTQTYDTYPRAAISLWREAGVWANYNKNTKRVEGVSEYTNVKIPSTQLIKTYNGFEIDTAQGMYLESLKNVDFNNTYYTLQLTWSDEMPLLLAAWLRKNTYPLSAINLNKKTIIFKPLRYEEKQQLSAILERIGGIKIIRKPLLWQ